MTISTASSPAASAHAAAEDAVAVTTESLLDGFDGELEMDPPEEARKEKRSTGKPSDLKPEDFDELDEPAPEEKPKPKKSAAPQAEPEEPAEPAEAKPEADRPWPKDKGTREKPLALKDLPDDTFVSVQVDGKRETISLKEYAQGVIRMESFHGAYNRAHQAYEEVTQIAQKAIQEREAIRNDLRALFRAPQRMFKHLFDHHPREMLDLGRLIAQQFKAWNEDPEAQRAHEDGIQQRQLQAERDRLQQERQRWDEQQQSARAAAEAKRAWAPVYEKVMKEAGFPKLTPEFQEDVKAFLEHAKSKVPDGKITAEVFEAVFRRVLKMHRLERVADRQPAAPVNPPRQATPKNGKGRDWDGVSTYEKMRGTDFFLR